jgi:hypothetical protein
MIIIIIIIFIVVIIIIVINIIINNIIIFSPREPHDCQPCSSMHHTWFIMWVFCSIYYCIYNR